MGSNVNNVNQRQLTTNGVDSSLVFNNVIKKVSNQEQVASTAITQPQDNGACESTKTQNIDIAAQNYTQPVELADNLCAQIDPVKIPLKFVIKELSGKPVELKLITFNNLLYLYYKEEGDDKWKSVNLTKVSKNAYTNYKSESGSIEIIERRYKKDAIEYFNRRLSINADVNLTVTKDGTNIIGEFDGKKDQYQQYITTMVYKRPIGKILEHQVYEGNLKLNNELMGEWFDHKFDSLPQLKKKNIDPSTGFDPELPREHARKNRGDAFDIDEKGKTIYTDVNNDGQLDEVFKFRMFPLNSSVVIKLNRSPKQEMRDATFCQDKDGSLSSVSLDLERKLNPKQNVEIVLWRDVDDSSEVKRIYDEYQTSQIHNLGYQSVYSFDQACNYLSDCVKARGGKPLEQITIATHGVSQDELYRRVKVLMDNRILAKGGTLISNSCNNAGSDPEFTPKENRDTETVAMQKWNTCKMIAQKFGIDFYASTATETTDDGFLKLYHFYPDGREPTLDNKPYHDER